METKIDLMKYFLGIDFLDGSLDLILEHYLKQSQNSIKTYCNIDEITEDLNSQVIELAVYLYKNRNQTGIVQGAQGSRSQTNERGIPQNIKDSLPLPRIGVV
ncbi:hypothetical protein GGQ84_001046 [Desulfitispora alkaliphila]|uniref:phage head-tail connector protein n=1 Tax=Desulfitispora alkaliphila TaxID=622674 RepID=UPI003D25CC0C